MIIDSKTVPAASLFPAEVAIINNADEQLRILGLAACHPDILYRIEMGGTETMKSLMQLTLPDRFLLPGLYSMLTVTLLYALQSRSEELFSTAYPEIIRSVVRGVCLDVPSVDKYMFGKDIKEWYEAAVVRLGEDLIRSVETMASSESRGLSPVETVGTIYASALVSGEHRVLPVFNGGNPPCPSQEYVRSALLPAAMTELMKSGFDDSDDSFVVMTSHGHDTATYAALMLRLIRNVVVADAGRSSMTPEDLTILVRLSGCSYIGGGQPLPIYAALAACGSDNEVQADITRNNNGE